MYCVDLEIWNKTKGEFAKRIDLDYHIDDSEEYEEYFPNSCKFILYSDDNKKKLKRLLNI